MNKRFVTLESGRQIFTLVDGASDAPPLVLLHGYPMNSHLWHHCIPALAQHFRVYAPDLPGYGQSDPALDVRHDLDFYTDFLLGFYAALGIDKAVLVGHDVGGMVALGMAVRHPARITRLVIMDTGPYPEWTALTELAIKLMGTWPFSDLLLTYPGFYLLMRQSGLYDGRKVTRQMVEAYRRPWVANGERRQAFRHVIRVPPKDLLEPREKYRHIELPTLVLWGEKDAVFGPGVGRKLAREIPNARFESVAKAGHFLQEERPAVVIPHLLNFLVPDGETVAGPHEEIGALG